MLVATMCMRDMTFFHKAGWIAGARERRLKRCEWT